MKQTYYFYILSDATTQSFSLVWKKNGMKVMQGTLGMRELIFLNLTLATWRLWDHRQIINFRSCKWCKSAVCHSWESALEPTSDLPLSSCVTVGMQPFYFLICVMRDIMTFFSWGYLCSLLRTRPGT